MQADSAAAFGDHERRVLGWARRHRERFGARSMREGRLFGEEGDVACNSDQLLDLVVVRRDLGVVERPVGYFRPRDGAQHRELLEVDVPEPRGLRVPVDCPSSDGLRKGLDSTGDRRGLWRRAVHAWLGGRVGLGEGPAHLQLVVREHGPRPVGAEIREVVGALLEDRDIPASSREHHRRDRPAGPAADYESAPAHQGDVASNWSNCSPIPLGW